MTTQVSIDISALVCAWVLYPPKVPCTILSITHPIQDN